MSEDNPVKIITTRPLLPLPPRQTIITARLLLRPFCRSDLISLHLLRTDPDVMQWEPAQPPELKTTLAQTQQRELDVHLSTTNTVFSFAIALQSGNGQLIGTCGIYHLQETDRWPSLAYKLARQHWGNGYATDAVQAMLMSWWSLPRWEWKLSLPRFTSLDGRRERVMAMVMEENERSQRVMHKVGGRQGRIVLYRRKDGSSVRLVTFAVEKD
jgi:RimJ/RimL family protein N-acetyltransferase